jgi:hypothetical protein
MPIFMSFRGLEGQAQPSLTPQTDKPASDATILSAGDFTDELPRRQASSLRTLSKPLA